jgi:hypothetical protein
MERGTEAVLFVGVCSLIIAIAMMLAAVGDIGIA